MAASSSNSSSATTMNTPPPKCRNAIVIVISVPTFKPIPATAAKEIDLQRMSVQDVKSLQKSDPFMYYSIPEIHKAAILHNDVDYSDITALADADLQHPRASQQWETTEMTETKVSRRTRVSVECQPDLFMEGLLDGLEQDLGWQDLFEV